MSLELIPNGDLIFKGPFNVVSNTTLKVSNSGTERLAYKIKTTAPKRYCVKPNSGFLDPRGLASIQVMLQPQAAGQQDDRSKHKFMVQWAAVPNTYSDDVENFWKQDLTKSNVQDSKLKCIFADEQPAAVVPNDTHAPRDVDAAEPILVNESRAQQFNAKVELPTINQRSTVSTDAGDDLNKSRIKQECERLKTENESLKESMKQQELRQRTAGSARIDNPVVDRLKPNQLQQRGLVLFGITFNEQLVLAAFLIALLLGFSLGYFLFSCGN